MKFLKTYVLGFFESLLSDDTKVSSKRVIALLAFITFEIACFVNLITGTILADSLIDGLLIIILGVLGIGGSEKIFSKRDRKIEDKIDQI